MFYVPVQPAQVRRAVIVVVTIAGTVATARTFPVEIVHVLNGLREGAQTLLIEHVLHHWGEILVAVGAAAAHHAND